MEEKIFFEVEDFTSKTYIETNIKNNEFDNCTFTDCTFVDADLTNTSFSECKFDNCDFSNAKLNNTVFREIIFYNCKLIGLRFDNCNTFLLSFNFEESTLNFSSFFQLELKKIFFKNCTLEEVEFTETDLTSSKFDNCDFKRARFENTILEKADLRTSYNFSINPDINKIKKAKFSTHNVAGLLNKYNIIVE